MPDGESGEDKSQRKKAIVPLGLRKTRQGIKVRAMTSKPRLHPSVCPHDCPSACALDVEVLDDGRIGRVRGAQQPYTAGVICAKVARYAETVHAPERILTPQRRVGPKGAGQFEPISWDEALDQIASTFQAAVDQYGPETVWPYQYAGTMGVVQLSSTNRLRHALGYSRQAETICSFIGGIGWTAGVGARRGVDAREMAESDLIVSWGCNLVATQVGAMHWISKARKDRNAKLVVVDPYRTPTAEKADLHLALRPGTDAALACAVAHVLFKEGYADRDYLARLTDFSPEVEAHYADKTPAWAAKITGLSEDQIIEFAHLYGSHPRSFMRFGYGFTRQRNGASAMHAATCLPAITGAWQHRGGGALCSSGKTFELNRSLLDGPANDARIIDMCRIGPALTGDARDLAGGPPVTAMLVQNCNPALVAPDSNRVKQGLSREDLFLVVHEQRMTETARYADILLPATTMLEHDDMYTSYGHTFLQAARAVIPAVGEARSNHWVTSQLAKRLGGKHPAFELTEWEIVDQVLLASKLPGADETAAQRWIDCAKPFEDAHFLNGFEQPDGKFHFFALWPVPDVMPRLPDQMDVIDKADTERPYKLIAAPSRHFLNSSFNHTATSRREAARPTALVHPEDCAAIGLEDGARVRIGNRQGEVVVWARTFDGLQRGVVVVEGIWPDADFGTGQGINVLTSAEPAYPHGGGVFHDTAVWLRPERA